MIAVSLMAFLFSLSLAQLRPASQVSFSIAKVGLFQPVFSLFFFHHLSEMLAVPSSILLCVCFLSLGTRSLSAFLFLYAQTLSAEVIGLVLAGNVVSMLKKIQGICIKN